MKGMYYSKWNTQVIWTVKSLLIVTKNRESGDQTMLVIVSECFPLNFLNKVIFSKF